MIIYCMIRLVCIILICLFLFGEFMNDDNLNKWFYDLIFPICLQLWYFGMFYNQRHNRIKPFLCFDKLWIKMGDWGWNKTVTKYKEKYPDKWCPSKV